MDENKLLDLPGELLYLWHAYRIEILFSAGLLVAAVQLAVHWRSRRAQPTTKSPPGSPLDEKRLETPHVPAKELLAEADHFDHGPPVATEPPTKSRAGPKRVTGVKRNKASPNGRNAGSNLESIQPLIFYYSVGGSTKAHAEAFARDFEIKPAPDAIASVQPPILHDLTELDYDDFFVSPPSGPSKSSAHFYLILLPSYNIDTDLGRFLEHLEETHNDFRIDTAPLSGLAGYSVFGFGDRQEWPTEQEGYCSQAVEVDKWMAKLTGRKRAFPLGMGDVRSDAQKRLEEWQEGVQGVLLDLAAGKGFGEGVVGSGKAVESEDEEEAEAEDEVDADTVTLPKKPQRKGMKRSKTADLEDLGGKTPIPVDFTTTSKSSRKDEVAAPKAMVPVSSPTYQSLTKQGYTIVGSHSGVKICRWTKSALRGRGSCYKFSFYGIASHLCMEATPSLSCSNKCVFCWRHGTNPVGTTWRWEVDRPELVFDGMKEGHYKKIKMMKGVPGVRAERFQEAMRIRHCALSLVGEPIFYPYINDLLAMLHREHISSFLVCNAQHPDQLESLGPVTQLYVSIDASNKESLKKIDRPLHRDFWERFIRCMDILGRKRFTHRTVFRLTLVKGFNVEEEAEGYADLVERALPGFVEVKGVTYCGTSTAAGAGLSMQNVPFYEEVCTFVLALEAALKRRGLDYGVGAEHAHSCCILLADRQRFFRPAEEDPQGEPKWHTLIDYAKFFQCLESGEPFSPEDYIGKPTPEWALWGKGGFDPRDQRVDRKGRPKVVEV
ncbi:hypothetical protein MBLNU230_g1806t1 [Neophaeotheca triangularis]